MPAAIFGRRAATAATRSCQMEDLLDAPTAIEHQREQRIIAHATGGLAIDARMESEVL